MRALAKGGVGQDANLVAEEAAGLAFQLLMRARAAHRHLLAGGDHHVLLALAGPGGDVAGELEEPVGFSGIAETTTTTSWPSLRAARARRATLRMRSASATEVPRTSAR